MEKIFEILKQLMPNFKGNKITLGGLFMLFFVILVASYFFLKLVMGCTFQNAALVIVWIIAVFSLSMAITCFYSFFVDWFEKQTLIKAKKKNLFLILDKSGYKTREFFKNCIDENTDLFQIKDDEQNILDILEEREIHILKTFYQGHFKYGMIKEPYFEWLKEYFKK